jgi:hypothetical protein
LGDIATGNPRRGGEAGMTMIGREKNGRVTVNYVCECADCDEAGRMTLVIAEHGIVACPGGCGAGYVPWKGPDGKWRLKNVVMPYYGDHERGDSVEQDEHEW